MRNKQAYTLTAAITKQAEPVKPPIYRLKSVSPSMYIVQTRHAVRETHYSISTHALGRPPTQRLASK